MPRHEKPSSIPPADELGALYRDVARGKSEAELSLDEIAVAARQMVENEPGDRYTNPKANLLAEKRGMLWATLEEIDQGKLSLELSALTMALADIYELSAPVHPAWNDYIKKELASRVRPPALGEPSKKEKAAYSVKGISILQNAFQRARLNRATLKRNPTSLKAFEKDYPEATIWDNQADANTLLSVIDTAFDIITIIGNRETLLHTAGDPEERKLADQENEKAAIKWLEDLKDEFKTQGKIRQPHAQADAYKAVKESLKPSH